VVPGIIDMHVHLREPGYEYKETVRSGTDAAAAGGVTTVACMANTDPVNDHGAITELIVGKAQEEGCVRVRPVGAITQGLAGEALSDIGELKVAGVVALSDDGRYVSNASLMYTAMVCARALDLVVISHCEDPDLSLGGVMNEGRVSHKTGLRGIPSVAEEIAVSRDVILAERTGCPIHIAHVSTRGSVGIIREAKSRGVPVTAEVAPHHLLLTEEAVMQRDTNTKVNPPLRTRQDVEALQEALADGTIDAIASDHAPHGFKDKSVDYDGAAFGISGLETLVGLTLTLVHQGRLSLDDWVRSLSSNPARILNIPGGSLAPGLPADITILDPERPWKVDPQRFRSKGKNSPFAGWSVHGMATTTIVGGQVVYSAEES
jgi:dihydroorotase